jgi:hypothetical protein
MPMPRHLLRKMPLRQRLRWRLDEVIDRIGRALTSAVCRIFGHGKPLRKLSCTICPRCYIVLKEEPRQVFNVTQQPDGTFKVEKP